MRIEFTTPVENEIFSNSHITELGYNPREIILNYPLHNVASNPLLFFEQVQQMYAREKRRALAGQPLPASMDLANPKHLKRMDSHTKVHVVTGLVEWGGSTTESIPYWDRQALSEGFSYVYPETAEILSLQADLETINGLRSVIGIIRPRYQESESAVSVLRDKIERGNVTRSDITNSLNIKLNAWETINNDYKRVLVAKIKHLVFIADKLADQATRTILLEEVTDTWQTVGLNPKELTINLGIDGGLSEATYRPPFYIVGIKQLEHLGQETISIPQDICPDWTLDMWVASLMREDGKYSLLQEPFEYKLDWRFERS